MILSFTTLTTLSLWLLQATAAPTSAVPSHFPGDETPYRVVPEGSDVTAGGDVNGLNVLGTWLYGYTECRKRFGSGANGVIDRAYYDAWLISNTEGVKSHIDWNSAAALEFLGPSAKNLNQQSQIQAVLANVATTIYSYTYPVEHYIKVRCDDPDNLCPRTCNGNRRSKRFAYSDDQDPSGTGYPFINFFPGFFDQYDLTNAIAFGTAQKNDKKYQLKKYDSRVGTFLHELFHLNLASGSPNTGPKIIDFGLHFKEWNEDTKTWEDSITSAYGALKAKVLARYQGSSSSKTSGYYVQRNAENLMLFALAKYVTNKLGGIYPYLPIVEEQSGTPFRPNTGSTLDLGYIANFYSDDNGICLEDTGSDVDEASNDCTDLSTSEDGEVVSIDSFTPDSDYPDEYISQRNAWLKALGAGDPATIDSGTGGQQIALATYIDPGANPETWNRLIGFPSDKVSVLVANVVNGPDSAINAGWTDVIPRAAASGKIVLGYVRTGYLGVSFQKFTTRLGSSKTSNWVAQIQEDVDQWYRLYPGHIGGIFFDEGWNDCGADNVNAELYRFITQSTKRKYSGAYTVLNPGAPMPKCFEHSADTLLTAEVSYATYTSSAYVDVDWTPSDPRKLWHIVYDVPAGQAAAVAKLALSRNVGMLQITDDVEPNPYDSVPDDAYMQNLMDAVVGGKPPNDGIFPWPSPLGTAIETSPGFLKIESSDYSSVTFSWPSSVNAAGYRLYQDSVVVLELMPSMSTVTVGGLSPGSSYRFALAAINPDGTSAGVFDAVSMKTLALPGKGHTVASTSVSASEGQTIYKAHILVPYAFVRIFIWKDNHGKGCVFQEDGGWPINYNLYDYACNYYMVEGGTLYSYSGKTTSANSNAPWSWTWVAEVALVQDGYDYTWTVPIGLSTISTHNYIVQVQGYGPTANVITPCPLDVGGVYSKVDTYCG